MAEDLTADVVFVGSGIAAAVAAHRLASQGVRTLIVEAGPRITREEALERYYASPERGRPGAPYPNASHAPRPGEADPDPYLVQAGPDPFGAGYERVVGGTTWHWESVCLRLLPADLRMKSRFGLAVDWPISYRDLAPWYDAAERELGVSGDASDDLGAPRSGAYPMPAMPLSYLDRQFAEALDGTGLKLHPTPAARNSVPHADRAACCGSGTCVPVCPSGAKYDAFVHVEAAERAGARIVANCVVHRVTVGADRRVSGLRFKRPDGSEGTIGAKVYVLAAHALETPKILLMSRSAATPDGVANGSGQVGRNLMDHPYKLSWALSTRPLWPFRGPIALSGIDGRRGGPARRERPGYRIIVGNAGWAWPTGAPQSTVEQLIAKGLTGEALSRAIRDHLSRQVLLQAMTEQLPDPENRIVPDFAKRDRIGIPRPKLFYRFDAYTHRGMAAAEKDHTMIFGRLGTGKVTHAPKPFAGGHILGTTRMGTDPRTSVVDPDLRTHDHPNLFLLGSGAFPTGGAANPTLTIAALSLRAVDALTRMIKT